MKDKIESATKAKALKEGEKLLPAHQKLIRKADRSEYYGWSTVAEYEDELADISDE